MSTKKTSTKKEAAEKEKEKAKADLRLKMMDLLKASEMEEQFTVALREKQKKGALLEYPERTICGCDGEVYNILMNWAYENKIPRYLAFDHFVEKFQGQIGDVKQRPKTADNSAMRYWKTKLRKRSSKASKPKTRK